MASQRKAGAVLGYVNIIVKNLVNLVYTPMLLAFVGQADYGVFQTSNSFVFSLTILSVGFSQAYVRFFMLRKINGTEDDIRELNGMYIAFYSVISLIALAIGLAFAGNVGLFFSSSFTDSEVGLAGELMGIMAFNVAATLFSTVFDAYVIANERFTYRQTRQIFTTLATPGLAFVLLNLGLGAVGVAIAQLAIVLVLLGMNASYSIKRLGMRFSLRHFDPALFKAVLVFSSWIFINQICDLINQSVPNIILGATAGASATAVFAVSIQIRNVFMSLSTTMSSVFVPKINRIVATTNDSAALTDLMARVGRYQMVLFVWVYGGFVLLGKFFIAAWAGNGFMDAYWLIVVMVAPLAFPLTQNTGIEIQRAKNRHKARSFVYLAMALLNLGLTAVLAPSLGHWAPVAGYVAYVVLGCGVFMNWYYQKRIGLDMFLFWRRVLPVALCGAFATTVCMLATMFLPVAGWISFLAWGAVFTLLYALCLYLFVMTTHEREAVKRFVHKRVVRR